MCCCCCYITSGVSNSVWPHRWQPTRLPRPWDSPGKNIGMGCHFLLQCMKVKSESQVAQSCPTLSDPMDCSPPGSSVHEIFQARMLEWVAISFSISNPGTERRSPALQADSLPTEPLSYWHLGSRNRKKPKTLLWQVIETRVCFCGVKYWMGLNNQAGITFIIF